METFGIMTMAMVIFAAVAAMGINIGINTSK